MRFLLLPCVSSRIVREPAADASCCPLRVARCHILRAGDHFKAFPAREWDGTGRCRMIGSPYSFVADRPFSLCPGEVQNRGNEQQKEEQANEGSNNCKRTHKTPIGNPATPA